MKARTLVTLFLVVVFLSCEKTTPSGTTETSVPSATAAPKDPVAQLKAHLSRTNSNYPKRHWSDIKYDVKKSDSLVSPYSGTVVATLTTTADPGRPHLHIEYEVTLAYRDDEWHMAELRALPVVVTGDGQGTSFGWHPFTAEHDGYEAYQCFQDTFQFPP